MRNAVSSKETDDYRVSRQGLKCEWCDGLGTNDNRITICRTCDAPVHANHLAIHNAHSMKLMHVEARRRQGTPDTIAHVGSAESEPMNSTAESSVPSAGSPETAQTPKCSAPGCTHLVYGDGLRYKSVCDCCQHEELYQGTAYLEVLPGVSGAIRKFDTGATRSADATRDDPEGYLSPLVVVRFSEYMTKHRQQPDGSIRDSDNWQKGIPLVAYMKGMWRHFLHLWLRHRGWKVTDPKAAESIEEDLCAIIFNAQGYLHEVLKEKE